MLVIVALMISALVFLTAVHWFTQTLLVVCYVTALSKIFFYLAPTPNYNYLHRVSVDTRNDDKLCSTVKQFLRSKGVLTREEWKTLLGNGLPKKEVERKMRASLKLVFRHSIVNPDGTVTCVFNLLLDRRTEDWVFKHHPQIAKEFGRMSVLLVHLSSGHEQVLSCRRFSGYAKLMYHKDVSNEEKDIGESTVKVDGSMMAFSVVKVGGYTYYLFQTKKNSRLVAVDIDDCLCTPLNRFIDENADNEHAEFFVNTAKVLLGYDEKLMSRLVFKSLDDGLTFCGEIVYGDTHITVYKDKEPEIYWWGISKIVNGFLFVINPTISIKMLNALGVPTAEEVPKKVHDILHRSLYVNEGFLVHLQRNLPYLDWKLIMDVVEKGGPPITIEGVVTSDHIKIKFLSFIVFRLLRGYIGDIFRGRIDSVKKAISLMEKHPDFRNLQSADKKRFLVFMEKVVKFALYKCEKFEWNWTKFTDFLRLFCKEQE